jgi:hypothetical protein
VPSQRIADDLGSNSGLCHWYTHVPYTFPNNLSDRLQECIPELCRAENKEDNFMNHCKRKFYLNLKTGLCIRLNLQ